MHKAFRYRFYPTPEQETLLRRTIGACRFVYNRALAIRKEAWLQRKEGITGYGLMNRLPLWKKDPETEWLKEVSSVTLQQSINDLEVSYRSFFTKQTKYPAFKKKSSGGSCRFVTTGFRFRDGQVWVARVKKPLDIRWSRPLPENTDPKQCVVRLTPSGEWYVTLFCEVEITKLPPVKKSIGLDMGISTLVTTSDGEKIANPKTLKKYHKKLVMAQRHQDRKKMGSKRRLRARMKVARIHNKITETRKDYLHKLTTRLVRENQSIAIEDLAIRYLSKNHSLAGSISDASWGKFRRMLEYKCKWYGRELKVVDRFFPSSKMCSSCGRVLERLPLKVKEWTCSCGAHHDRDINAAINILSAGTVDYTDGEIVRPKRTKSVNADLSEVGILTCKGGERSKDVDSTPKVRSVQKTSIPQFSID